MYKSKILPMNLVPRPETEILKQHLERAKSGCGSVVFVSGEIGSGKTTLVSNFSNTEKSCYHDIVTTAGSCSAITGEADPFHPFKQILQDLIGEKSTRNEYMSLFTKLAPGWLGVIPVVGALAGAIVETGVEVSGFINKGSQTVSREEMFSGFLRLLRSISGKHPIVIFIDDLHWIDPSSANLIFYLAKAICSLRVLIICAYRPSEIELRGGHPARQVINEIIRYGLGTVINLGGLSDYQIKELVKLHFPNNYFPSGFFDTLLNLSGGNVLFINSILESIKGRNDLLAEDKKGWFLKAPIEEMGFSKNVQSVVQNRIDKLPDQLRDLCDIASVEGSDFTYEVVLEVAKQQFRQTDVEVIKNFRSLEKTHRIIQVKSEKQTPFRRTLISCRFIHGLFQEVLYKQLPLKMQMQYHLLIADALEKVYDNQLDDISYQLAIHYQRAMMPNMAGAYFYRSAANSRLIHATLEAENHLISAMVSLERLSIEEADSDLFADCIHMRAHVSGLGLRKFTEAVELYHRCLRIRDSLSCQEEYVMDCFHMMGVCYSVLLEFRKAKRFLTQALDMAEALEKAGQPKRIDAKLSPLGNPPGLYAERQGNILRDLGRTFQREGQDEAAERYYERSLTLLRSGQDKGGIADTQFFIGLVYLARGEINEAEDRFMSALVNRQEDTKYEHRVTLNSYLADSAFRQEKWDEGFHYAEEARRLIRDHRLNYRQVRFVVTFAERYLTKHRYQDAFDTFAEAISLATFMDLRDYESILNKILDVIDGLVQTECFELAFRFCDTLIDSAISSPFSKTPESVLFWNRAKEYIQDPKNRRLREYVFRHD